MVPLQGAIAVCHCSVLWFGGEWTWCHCRVPLQCAIVVCYGLGGSGRGAIAGCHCSVLWLGGDDQLWENGRGAIVGCHCRVPL